MKLAVIGSPQNLLSVKEDGLSYHFALGQHLWNDPEYYEWYWNAKLRGGFIIVDNGAAEPLQERVSITKVIQAALELDADEIILPDRLRDKRWTSKYSLMPSILEMVPVRKRMVVPQGKDWLEWTDCLMQLVEGATPASIGVPKWLEDLPGGRAHAVDTIVRLGYADQCHIHLLGIRRRPYTEPLEVAKVYPFVRGLDTAAPIAYAQHGVTINDTEWFSSVWNQHALKLRVRTNVYRYHRYLGQIAYLAEKETRDGQTPTA